MKTVKCNEPNWGKKKKITKFKCQTHNLAKIKYKFTHFNSY